MKVRDIALASAFAGLAAMSAQATTLVSLSVEQLSQASTLIVRGRVINQESRWNAQHTQILTLTQVAVGRSFKGSPGGTVTIEQPGGTVGNIHVRVAGTIAFRPDAEYFLFLEPARESAPHYVLVGMAQGAYRIYRDAETDEERLIRPFGGVFHGGPLRAGDPKPTAQSLPVREFAQHLAAALRTRLRLPAGTRLPVTIREVETLSAGRIGVRGETLADIFPNATVVVPAGSTVAGSARLGSGRWVIQWSEVSIRGEPVEIKTLDSESAAGRLRGQVLMVTLR